MEMFNLCLKTPSMIMGSVCRPSPTQSGMYLMPPSPPPAEPCQLEGCLNTSACPGELAIRKCAPCPASCAELSSRTRCRKDRPCNPGKDGRGLVGQSGAIARRGGSIARHGVCRVCSSNTVISLLDLGQVGFECFCLTSSQSLGQRVDLLDIATDTRNGAEIWVSRGFWSCEVSQSSMGPT